MPPTSKEDNEIKLYSLLVDQLFRHQTVIWQIPTALFVANIVSLYNFQLQPFPLFALSLFNAGLIFVFYRMLRSQSQIIDTIKNAENDLNKKYSIFLPHVKGHSIKAPYVFLGIIVFLEISLGIYILFLFMNGVNIKHNKNDIVNSSDTYIYNQVFLDSLNSKKEIKNNSHALVKIDSLQSKMMK